MFQEDSTMRTGRTLYKESSYKDVSERGDLTPRLVKTDMGTILMSEQNTILGIQPMQQSTFNPNNRIYQHYDPYHMTQSPQLMVQGNSNDFSRKEVFPYPIYELADSVETFRSPAEQVHVTVSPVSIAAA